MGLDEESLRVCDERAAISDAIVQFVQPEPIAVDGEPGHSPANLAQEVHNSTDVVEHRTKCLLPQGNNDEPSVLCSGNGALRAPYVTRWLRSHHELGELPDRSRADLLRQVSPTAAGPVRSHPTM
jgi:hypothetical protein